MDLIYLRTDEEGNVTSGYLRNFSADFDITTDLENVTNDFKIEMDLPEQKDDLLYEEGQISTIVFCEGTEFGGVINGSVIDVSAGTISYTGRTWRGMLSGFIVEPPSGQDYLVVSGNLATSLRKLPMGQYIDIADTDYSGGSFTFDRYITTLEGATKLLQAAESTLRMQLAFYQEAASGKATLAIVEARDLTSLIEVSQDYSEKVKLKITRDHTTPRCLICLGQGELQQREVIKLYADEDWNITRTAIEDAYPVDIYDYSSSTSLEADGRKKYAELIANHEQIEVIIEGLGVQLSDIISGRDQLTGETVTAEITNIIWTCKNYGSHQEESFEYKTKVRIQ